MSDFLRFVDHYISNVSYLHFELTYTKITDWCIYIWKKGAGPNGKDQEICSVQDCDLELCCAKAHVAMKKWLLDNEGGY